MTKYWKFRNQDLILTHHPLIPAYKLYGHLFWAARMGTHPLFYKTFTEVYHYELQNVEALHFSTFYATLLRKNVPLEIFSSRNVFCWLKSSSAKKIEKNFVEKTFRHEVKFCTSDYFLP